MKKRISISITLSIFCASGSVYAREPLEDILVTSSKHALEWYNNHTQLIGSALFLGLLYCLYKKYCPVASRCQECSLELNNLNTNME